MFNIFAQMAFNLCLTVVIETAVAFLLKVRNIYDIFLVVLVNCITNPILNLLMNVLVYFVSFKNPIVFPVLIVFEISVVFIEGMFFRKTKVDCGKINPFLFSLILNGSSFAVGEILTIITQKL